MHYIAKGLEESGRVLLLGEFLRRIGIEGGSVLWNGLYSGLNARGRSPLVSGLVAGYVTGIPNQKKILKSTVLGGVSGTSIALTSKVIQQLLQIKIFNNK
ncbi:hypothetical protein NEHOM01_0596 [Nematocida homosporus]|uniref:uncharacterized protein n=1 Tax=Nematocida homosporus TaxID=1912981 RepID=UPI00222079F0|nr:uncharacterized protein NEHOM01_0596 [Nematocida homosporus]KAI5185091.1 hypothetical protein NEHOM01_0596 [Nematocida homosporus]